MPGPVVVTVFPTETVIVAAFGVAGDSMKTVQVTNLDPTQTVTCLPYLRVGTEALAAIQSPELQGIPPLKPAILQLNVRNLSALELRGTTDGIGAQVQVTIV